MSSGAEESAAEAGEAFEADVFSSACTSRTALQHLTGRWGSLIIVALKRQNEPLRFGEIRRRVEGVSERMLSQTLGQLERDGMVTRTVHSTIPPNVDYGLTPLGAKIAEPLAQLIAVVESELPLVFAAQQQYDDAGKRG
ncbi:MAG: winged helix-turn-helix transcriptional regulator [Micrococcaceae bacterium]